MSSFGRGTLGALAYVLVSVFVLASPSAARADDDADRASTVTASRTSADEIPIVAWTYAARGTSAGSVGAYGDAATLFGNRRPTLGGGATAWGAPVDRLTLVGEAARDPNGSFAPSGAVLVRLLDRGGAVVGALGKYKVEGFGTGPSGEFESEAEVGLLFGWSRAGFHADVDAIGGRGFGDDGELDAEGRLRLGYDVSRVVRVGADGQARYRLAGTYRLPGNRRGDFAAGPQLIVGGAHLFGALTAGPSTTGVVDRALGMTAVLSLGGVAY